jgi:hypothetical protein
MLSHSHITKPIGQIFSDLYPEYVVQCIGGDNLTYHVKVVPPIPPIWACNCVSYTQKAY